MHVISPVGRRAFGEESNRYEGSLCPDNCTVAPANGRITGTQIRIVAVVVLGAFLALLNQTVMSPALPVIMSDFAIDASTAQWIMSIYPLVSGIMVPVSAFLIDSSAPARYSSGRRWCSPGHAAVRRSP
ncbi:MAG: MFS transporter [Collinsella sp.]